jgi:hypothetical protein
MWIKLNYTILVYSSIIDKISIFTYLFNKVSSKNKKRYIYDILYSFTSNGNLTAIKYVFKYITNDITNDININYNRLLNIAACNGYLDIIKFLYSKIQYVIPDTFSGAAKNNHYKIIKYIIKKNIFFNKSFYFYEAAVNNNYKIVKL